MLLPSGFVGPGSACVPQAAFGVSPKVFQSRALSETLNAAPETGALSGPQKPEFLDVFSRWIEMIAPRSVTRSARSLSRRGGRRRLTRA